MREIAPVVSLPAAWYTDAAQLAREREHVLSSGWYYAGDARSLAEGPGYAAVTVAAMPLILTRDEGGRLHALANVCPHRGSVVADRCATRRTLQCRYHGWTYRLDGRLHRAPNLREGLDGIGLRRLALEQVGTMLFVCAAAEPPPLRQQLAPWLQAVEHVAGIDLHSLTRRRRISHRIAANWKAVVENFLECYHCPLVHATTLPGFGDNDYRVQTYGELQVQRLDRQRFAFGFLFPATQLSAYGADGALVARSLSPAGPSITETTLDYWFAGDVADCDVDEWVRWFESVVAEDIPLCESVQVGLSSCLLEAGLLDPDREVGPLHFQELLAARLTNADA